MSYKLFSDVDRKFTCKVDVDGVKLNECSARMVILSENGPNLLYEGKIDGNGNCEINLKRVKNLLDENSKGNLKLEVIADNTIFTPWESEFIVETKKKVKVAMEESEEIFEPVTEVFKPKISVTVVDDDPSNNNVIKKQINILESTIKKNKINEQSKFNIFFDRYSELVKSKYNLSESDLSYIKTEIINNNKFIK